MTDLDRTIIFAALLIIGFLLWQLHSLLDDMHNHLARMEENMNKEGLKNIFKGLDLYKDKDEED